MKCRLPWLLLLISLAGNLFFVGGYLYGDRLIGHLRSSPEARMERLARRLALSDGQRRELLRASQALVRKARRLQARRRETLRGFWRTVSRPEADVGELERRLKRLGTQELAYRRQVVADIRAFMERLTEPQKRRFVRLLERNSPFRFLDDQAARRPTVVAGRPHKRKTQEQDHEETSVDGR